MAEKLQKTVRYVETAREELIDKVDWTIISRINRIENNLRKIRYEILRSEKGEWKAKLSEKIRRDRAVYEFALALFNRVGYRRIQSGELRELKWSVTENIPQQYRDHIPLNPYPRLFKDGILEREAIVPGRTYNYRFHQEATEFVKKELSS